MHDIDDDLRPHEAHRQHRQERLSAGDDARIVAVLGKDRAHFGDIIRADIIEARRFQAPLPNRRANRLRLGGPPAWRASAVKNCRITILAAPSSSRPPTDATLPPISAS